MGQKVHPLGFRVGITKKHQSQWFARFNKYAYSQSVVEDHMLRKTLTQLLPELLNPVVKKAQKIDKNSKQEGDSTPKITQIKIERGLIPYEIGIKIHAENCNLVKSAFGALGSTNNVKINPEILTNLQKNRHYLSKVVSPIQTKADASAIDNGTLDTAILTGDTNSTAGNVQTATSESGKKRTFQKALNNRSKKNASRRVRFGKANGQKKTTIKGGLKGRMLNAKNKRTKNAKRNFKKGQARLIAIKKRLTNRQFIRTRYAQFLSKGLLIQKSGNSILRTVNGKGFSSRQGLLKKGLKSAAKLRASQPKKFSSNKVTNQNSQGAARGLNHNQAKTRASINNVGLNSVKGKNTFLQGFLGTNSTSTGVKVLSKKLSKKFATLYVNKLNKKFLVTLKGLMKYWHKNAVEQGASKPKAVLGLNKKWSSSPEGQLQKLKSLKTKPLVLLVSLLETLEKKSLKKLFALRKDFMVFGTISKTRSFGYYQLITFLKQLKELVNKLKKQNASRKAGATSSKARTTTKIQSILLSDPNSLKAKTSLTQTIFNKVVNNLDNGNVSSEMRKMQLINYLQNIVKSHRQANIFYYLSSMAVASKDLQELKRYTKKHSNFLFGINPASLNDSSKEALQEKIEKVLAQSNKKPDFEKKLQDAFLEQIENQRRIYKANLALTPKISIKFFSVKTENILEKASVVADSIVDALEKRKAFRGVIKKAKEDLMRRSRVKGVKIQVSGRLNGAEIARSEWVRAGRVPLQTLRANIDYSYRTASTIYGIIGVKVWIFKGYVN